MSRTPLYLCVLFVAPAVARSPAGSPPDLVQLAESQIVAGQRPEAAATYRQALEVLERLPPEELTASQPEIELALRRLAFLSAKYGEGARSLPSFLALSEPREGADPLLSALARYHAGYASLQTDGDLDRAREIWKPLGFLESWWVVGSFDNERGGSFHTAYGPEKDIDLEAVYDGKKRPIHWRRLPARPVAGRVDLDALFRPSDECLAYALTFVHSESDQPAALRLGSDEGYKVWVNGDLAGSEDLHRRALFDQSVVGIRLLRGWNSVLLKIAEAKGSWEFRARLGRPDGRPLEGWREGQLEPDALEPDSLADVRQRFRRAAESRGKSGEGEAPAKGEAVACHRGVVEQLRKRIAGSPADARAHYLLGTLLLERRAHDTSQHPDTEALRQALKIDDSAVITYHSLARSYQRQTRVAAERDDNSWRQAMEQAAARGSVLASYRLAAYYLNTFRNYRAARHHLDRVLQANPRMVGAILLRGQLESALEYPLSWEKAVAAALEAAPESFRALSAHADLLVSRGGVTGAERLVRDLLARNHLARDRRATLVQLLVDRGKSEEARHWIELGERLRPFGTGAREQLASLALARDDAAEAVRHLSRALEIRPEDHGLHEKRGRAQWRLGDREAALASWSRALELQPNLPDLRERVDFLRSRGKSFEDEFRRPTAELIAKELELTPPSGEEEPARILLQTTAVEVNRDGTSREFVQTVVQVLNDGGVRSFDVFSTTYAAGDQLLEFKKARVHRRDGTTADANLSRHRGRGRSGYRRASVDLPSLSPGDIFEVEYIREDITQSFFGDYYGRREFFQGNLSIADKAFVLRVPASRKFHFHQRNLDLERERHEDAENEQVTYTWRKKDIPRVEPEPGMPPAQELYPLLEISTFADWEEFSGWYHNLIKKQFEASPEIVAKVQELSSGARNDLERIRAIYNFVVTEIRYNAWEFGVHGFKPYNASTVFTRKFGDCKDKATLMTVMLGELGIDSQPVLIHADRRRGREDLTLPMVHHFNHCITYVPESSGRPALFLDGTAARHSLEELPSMDRGARVLIVREEEATVADIPWNTTADLSVEEEWTVDIREDRSARLEVRVRARGDYATSLRRVYEVAARRRETLERAYGRRFAGATVVAQSFSDLGNLDEPVSFSVVVEVPRFVSPSSEGPGIALPDDFFGSGGELAILGSLEKRQFDVLLGNPRRSLLRVRCRLPPELAWKSWPRARRLSGRHGRFEVEFDQKEGELHLRRLIEITAHRLSLDDYTAFREFTAAIASLAEEKIILKDS